MTDTFPPVPPVPNPQAFSGVSLDDFAAYQTGWQQRNDALLARITELETPPAPAPPTPALAWGANIGTNTGRLAKVDTAMAGIGAARFYFSAGKGLHWPTAAELGGDLGSRILILSSKITPQDIAAGKYDAQITATAKAAPTDRPTPMIMWHEPWDDVYKHHTFTTQQFRDGLAHYADLIHAVGNPHLMVTLCLMGETWNGGTKTTPRDWREFYPGPQYVDLFTTDEYVWGPGVSLDNIFAKGRAAADSEGKPFSVTETGIDPSTYPAPAAYDALTKLAQRAKAVSNGPVAMYFGPMHGDRWDITTDPKRLAAWKAGQA